ncbi:MAG TPA: XrtA/PEP-CTERM system TPR-repeat protein PrsT [Stellaceae bacterium]|nr:XrtA/PEP-CTERM system TPR-repeat protein PrsT [Stellaceae bacterium]
MGVRAAPPRTASLLFAAALALWAAAPGAAARSDAEGYIASGRKLMERGDFAGAAIEFRNAVQSDPASGEAHYGLGLALVRSGDVQHAEDELRAGGDAGFDRDRVEAGLAELFLKQERYGQILSELHDGSRSPALEAQIRIARGYAAFNLRETAEAEQEFAAAIELAPNPAEAEAGLAQARIAENDLKGGAALLEKAVAGDAHLVKAWVLLARVRDALGDHAGALAAIGRALAVAPEDAAAHLSRAELVVDEDAKQAAADVAAVLDQYPENGRANLLDALIKARRQEWREAEAALMRIPHPEALPQSLFLLARVNLAQGEVGQAGSNIAHYLSLVPDDPAGIGIEAAVLTRRGKPGGAIDLLKKALAAHPDDIALLGLLSDAYARNGQPAEAAATLDRIAAAAPRDAASRTDLAARYLAAGRPEQALEDLAIARASAPLSIPAVSVEIEADLAAGKVEAAAAAADDLIRRNPTDPLGETLRGIVALRKESVEAARAHFSRALELQPDFVTAIIDLAQSYRVERRFAEARAVYDRSLARNAKSVPLLMARADLEFAEGKTADGIAWLERARGADAEAPAPRFRLIGIYIAQKDGAKAVAVARELEAIQPRDPKAIAALGDALLANGDRQTAIETFERVVDMTGQAPDALVRLAEVLVLDGKVPAAYSLMRKAIETNPDDPRIQQALIAFSRKTDTVAASVSFARDLGARAPGDAAIDELTGQLLEAEDKFAEAAEAYAAGVKKAPSSRLTRRLAEAQFRAGAPDAARATLAQWLEAKPDDRAARFLLAGLLAGAKDDSGAIAQYERLVAEKPDDPLALNELAWLYQLTGDGRAAAVAEKARAAAPQSPTVADTLGWILLQKGETERGAALLREAAASPVASPTIRYHLAVALGRTGERDAARRLLDELLQSAADFPDRAAAQKLAAELGG